MTRIARDPVRADQESVWDYPRPAVAQPTNAHVRIIHRGTVLVDTRSSVRTLETSHPPTYYCPQSDILMPVLRPNTRTSFCEWKGNARYYDVIIGDECFADAAWGYPDPTSEFRILRNHIAFYAAPFDRCSVDGERVEPQPGGFYGGWITDKVAGPFKGVPGSRFW